MTMLRPAKAFSYGYWVDATEPGTGLPVPGLGSRRFWVFNRHVRLQSMELTRPFGCRGGRPERVTVETFDGPEPDGQVVFEGLLPWPATGDTCRVEFPPVVALAASARCHWRGPVEESFMEWHPTQYTVPFDIFDGTCWYGDDVPEWAPNEPPAPPPLIRGKIDPRGTDEVTATTDGLFVVYRSRFLRVGFSLVRPRMSWLSWDGLGTQRLDENFLVDAAAGFVDGPCSGPWRRDLGFELPSRLWTGEVEVDGARVTYRNVRSLPGFSMDVQFDIGPTGFSMRIVQHNETQRHFLEAEAWQWAWDGRRVCSLSTLAMPRRGAHRNGIVEPLGGWHCSGHGVLAFRPVGEAPVGLQVDTSGFAGRQAFAGLLLGVRPEPFGPATLLAGSPTAEMEFEVTNLEPQTRDAVAESSAGPIVHAGLRRGWGTQFAFRPEHGGFANNAFGVNAENCLYMVADLAPYARTPDPLPAMTDLLRYTVELAVQGGPGYACFLNEAHDTAPSQLIAIGAVWRIRSDRDWLQRLWPFVERRINRILDNLNEDGFYICKRLSGNSRSHHTSCNAWDTFSIGHADGYSGALAYRGLRNATALARAVDRDELGQRCDHAASRLREAFVPTLLNPRTGWLAGWRSADGTLHDYAMHFVTAMAVNYDILESDEARQMMERLERKRVTEGLDDLRYGLPPQFMPVAMVDHWSRGGYSRKDVPHRQDGADTYGIFTNGGVTPVFAGQYIMALSRTGLSETADRLCDALLESFEACRFDGCLDGRECYTLDGMPSGYEGTLSHSFHVLLAIGLHKGWIEPLAPPWWPA